MRARLFDRRGPRTSWLALLALAGVAGIFSVFRVVVTDEAPGQEILACFALLTLGLLTPARFAPRQVTLEIRPGEVQVKGSPLLAQTVLARDVIGASTARHGEGFVVSVQTTRRDPHPLSFLVETAEDASRLRTALGIGHDGTGEIAWRTEEPSGVRTGNVLAWIAFAVFSMFLVLPGPSQDTSNFLVISGLMYGTLPLLFALMRLKKTPTNRVILRPEALYLPTLSGPVCIGYWDLASVSRHAKMLFFTLKSGATFSVEAKLFPPEELDVLIAQLENARRRAAGEVIARQEVGHRLAMLERGSAPVPSWLARLDGLAAGLAGGGYRSSHLDREALWIAMEDPDTPSELRLATARILGRIEPRQRVRIAELAEASRSPAIARGIRVACEVDDVDRVADVVTDVWDEFDAFEGSAARPARATR